MAGVDALVLELGNMNQKVIKHGLKYETKRHLKVQGKTRVG